MIASAISGGFAMYFGVKSFGFILQGLEAVPVYIDPENSMNLVYAGISVLIAFVISFVVTLFLGFEDVPTDEVTENDDGQIGGNTDNNSVEKFGIVGSPLKGEFIPLDKVPDKTFAEEILGTTLAIHPSGDSVVSPFDGAVVMVYPTKHAIGLKSGTGVEVLIHIGLETVNLGEKHFDVKVEQGEIVKKGQELITFDRQRITDEGYNIATLIIVTNGDQFEKIDKIDFDQGHSIEKTDDIIIARK